MDQLELNKEAQQKADRADTIYAAIKDFDGDMALCSMPGYTQVVNSLTQAVKTIDILLAAYDKGANPEHFAAVARLDLKDILLHVGDINR